MKHILAFLLMLSTSCWAQVPMTGAGKSAGGAPAYTGPGNIVASARAYYSIYRCYTSTYSGNVAHVFNVANGSITTLITCSAGGIINETINPLSTTCATLCRADIIYDQTNSNSCGTGSDCNMATNPNYPAVTLNCIGTFPCFDMSTNGAATKAFDTSLTQPFTMTMVSNRTSGTTLTATFEFTGSITGLYYNGLNAWFIYAGSFGNASETDGAWHLLQGVFDDSGGGSKAVVDGSATGVTAGTGATGANILNFTAVSTQLLTEATIWPNNFSTGVSCGSQTACFSALSSNAKSYWGYP